MTNVVSSLADIVERQPDATALIFLADGETDERVLTFAEVEACSRVVAGRLAGVVSRGDRVLVMCEPGLDYVVAVLGCLYAGVIAVPAYRLPRSRWRGRWSDCVRSWRTAGLGTP